MPEVSHETLIAYLRQHGDYYTLEALRKSLLGQGFDAAAVEAACQSYLAETPSTGPKLSKGEEAVQGCATVVLAVLALAVLAVGTCVVGYFVMMNSKEENSSQNCSLFLAVVFFLVVLLPLKIIQARRKGRKVPGHGGRDEGPAPPLSRAPPVERTEAKTTHEILLAYLRQHAPTTGVEEMRAHLLAEGYDPEAIQAAFMDYWSRGESR
ncbi:MAG TPA: hypothetical protein VFE33_24375 [Thermoanaerobaculia bacterium]|nr:hypothetical protein [Thermoanaerobaculia bacterium]